MAQVIKVRFLTNKKTSEIMYAEAEKEFVDLLFSFLTLPLGSVLNLLSPDQKEKEIASINNLYESMVKLPEPFVTVDKSELLSPKVAPSSSYSNQALRIDHGRTSYYVCGNNRSSYHVNNDFSTTTNNHYMSTKSGETCACGNPMNCEVSFRPSSSQGSSALALEGSSGYVKETVTFIISNDLTITPSSTITSINLLNRMNIRDLSDLEEKTASVGPSQVLELLRASLVSKTPLNDVFSPTLFGQQ